ncbi:MAG: glycosyltransferase [Candidatus Lokiarchaeota archaeon]|nr:glycosyltransferase [Candidatus Lokiarchaeota archaeon]
MYSFNIFREAKDNYCIDLIVLCHNCIETTQNFLDLFYKNTDPYLVHLILLDNGSTDSTVEFLKEFCLKHKNMSLLLSDKNLGVIGGRNAGYDFTLTRLSEYNEYLMYLDNDQFVQNGWLEQYLDFLSNKYDLVGVEAWQMNKRFIPIRKIEHKNEHFTYVGCGGMLIQRKVVDDLGMFDERFNPAYFEDPDFVFRCYQSGYKIGWNYDARIVHFPHQTLGKLSQQEKSRRFTNSLFKFREKWKGFNLPVLRN